MKTPVTYLLLAVMLISCTDNGKLTFEAANFNAGTCTDCPQVSVSIPMALAEDRIATTINTTLKEEVISLLTFDDDVKAVDIEGAIGSFKNGFLELKKKYPTETIGWEANIEGSIAYENVRILTVELGSYIFTGGAHGYSATRFLNFDKKKGVELEDWELFRNQKDFKRFAETKFRIQEDIPQDAPINSTGFMFERNEFYLPENIGFTQEGLQLLYNQYEVASYADGPIVLILPYAEVKSYLSGKTRS
ncbi:DUF3298 domain-containing protein [Flavobacteriaceae bacterium 3-367]|uniref:DUF3298 and DUF4163 domain-containing protein n=1 Tax=Eudoraea algarum TaxID=3417568 RepID=UPI00328BCA00